MSNITLPFRYKKIKDKYLVTNDYFDWTFLDEKEFQELKENKIGKDSELYKKLVKENIILSENKQANNLINKKQSHNSFMFTGPALHIIVLTKRCNHKCVYCHAASTVSDDKSKFDLSKEDAKKFVELMMTSPNPFLNIEFQGGEPLLNFETLKCIVDYTREVNKKLKKDLVFTVVTNLEDMDDEKFEYLTSNNIRICSSLDGPKFLHDKNRESINTSSSYDNVTKWIKKAKEKGVHISALITVSRESLKYPKEIVDEFVKLGYSGLHLRVLNYLGKAIGKWKDIGYTAEEFIEFWKKAMDYIMEINKEGKFFTERTCNIILQKVLNKFEPNFIDLMSPCGAVIGQIAYNYDGKIYSCDEARTFEEDIFQVGDVNSESIPKIVKSQKSVEIISSTFNDSYFCNYCAYKSYCGVCPVCNYKETGNPICDILRTSRCKILMAQFDYIFEKLQKDDTKKILSNWINNNLYKDKIIIE